MRLIISWRFINSKHSWLYLFWSRWLRRLAIINQGWLILLLSEYHFHILFLHRLRCELIRHHGLELLPALWRHANLRLLLEQVDHAALWSGELRKLLQLAGPIGGDGDGLFLLILFQDFESVILWLPDEGGAVLRLDGGQDVEEVLPVAIYNMKYF